MRSDVRLSDRGSLIATTDAHAEYVEFKRAESVLVRLSCAGSARDAGALAVLFACLSRLEPLA
jgi:hypothetical protein